MYLENIDSNFYPFLHETYCLSKYNYITGPLALKQVSLWRTILVSLEHSFHVND